MSDTTFRDLWTRLLVYAPQLPLPLAQEFTNTSYSRALAYYPWTNLRAYDEFVVPAVYQDGTASVTQDSATVTGNGTAFTSAMLNRQFYVGNQAAPLYTIIAIDTGAQTLTLDRPFEKDTDPTASYQITQVLVEMPSDFLSLEVVRDIVNNWRLYTTYPQKRLDLIDARRQVSGTPWIMAYAPPRIQSNGIPVQRYELWPRCLPGPKTYAFTYIKKPPLMTSSTERPIYPIRGDAIRLGALVELTRWPGTTELKNPYFDMNQHQVYEREFQDRLEECWKDDQMIGQSAISYRQEPTVPWAPIDAKFIQSHDVFTFSI